MRYCYRMAGDDDVPESLEAINLKMNAVTDEVRPSVSRISLPLISYSSIKSLIIHDTNQRMRNQLRPEETPDSKRISPLSGISTGCR
ncbi:unnamed protein product [Caenorhabditis auriculariae]|uniref:Uncharacterized protein n=1 Tax=Caenorhabditis auriculariae TaxID=2777116 RepID=A0A8S1GUJ5_9PELO|nr:unnamed protein product [Caenorhabditis auriculariae]